MECLLPRQMSNLSLCWSVRPRRIEIGVEGRTYANTFRMFWCPYMSKIEEESFKPWISQTRCPAKPNGGGLSWEINLLEQSPGGLGQPIINADESRSGNIQEEMLFCWGSWIQYECFQDVFLAEVGREEQMNLWKNDRNISMVRTEKRVRNHECQKHQTFLQARRREHNQLHRCYHRLQESELLLWLRR